MSEAEEKDKKDDALTAGLAHASATTKTNVNASVNENHSTSAHSERDENPSHHYQDQSIQLASDTHEKPTAPSSEAINIKHAGRDNPRNQGQETAADYFAHQESPAFNTTSSLVLSHDDLNENLSASSPSASSPTFPVVSTPNTPNVSETEQPVPLLPSRLAPIEVTSTLTTALNNSRSRSNSNSNNGGTANEPPVDIGTEGIKVGPTSTSAPVDAPETENIDPVASYSAWRKKKDKETFQGTQAVMESFLKQHSAYDVLPVNIVSAPLWDSTKRKFAGMLTATDFINLIQFYYSHSSYTAAIREMDQFQISQLRDVEKVIGVPPPELFSLHPLQSLYDACQLLVESRAHRLPLVDVDSETGEEMIVSVLTQYRILKFIAMNYQDEKTLRQPLSELKIGIYTDLAVADLSTPVMSVIDMFVKRRISSVPIVDDEGIVLNVFETVDVMVG
ncbi:AMP-activated serine/threonine-protein kinase regulatory subunit [Modicella reniformis]|uniref:AMP-activated serine/threonine-protein kinase regulatory subunit n=1 Tax=Modicella reniformis TaxID=1440133 RepID=A0A9P6M8V0_9FUNG|nr:AMP-activated serine/threonine-protein kinase regulatory subunit [Modicella reniformis]